MIEDLHDASRKLDRVELKLDKIIEFNKKLEPYLPLLARASEMLANPAQQFRRMVKRGG